MQWIAQLAADFPGSEDISAFIQGHPFSIKSRHGLNKRAAEIKGGFFPLFFSKSLKRCIGGRVVYLASVHLVGGRDCHYICVKAFACINVEVESL